MAQGNFCSNCGAAKKPASLFCSECGFKYPSPAAPPTAPAAPAAPLLGLPCKACGNLIKPGDKFCSKCLAKVSESTISAMKNPGSDNRISPRKQNPLPKIDANAIPTVEVWQVEVTRNVAGAASHEGNFMVYTFVSQSDTQVTQVPLSPTIFEYPQIQDTQVDDQSGLFREAKINFIQKERMAVIIDSVRKKLYCLVAPEIKFLPMVRGVGMLALTMSNHKLPTFATPMEWARFSEGDFIKNYLHLPVSLGKDYASFFTVIPLTSDPKEITGIFAGAKSIMKNHININLEECELNIFNIDKCEPERDHNEKIQSLAAFRDDLNALVSTQPATTAIPYKQRVCSVCGSLLIFDPNENALYCHGCAAFVRRFGMPPLQALQAFYLENYEKQKKQVKDDFFTSLISNIAQQFTNSSESDLNMMRRAAFCPRCSSWLKYVFIPQLASFGTVGNHQWYCPHCLSACREIIDRPLNLPHHVICSHCGSRDVSLERDNVPACPSCGSQFMSAGWESMSPMPEKDPNEYLWEYFNFNLMQNYVLAGRPSPSGR